MAGNNLKRLLADLVSVDAWHTPFNGETGDASLHIDAVFAEARIGGDEAAPVRFRLSLKRAEIVAIVPENEPLQVQRSSVMRDQPIESVKVTTRSERKHGIAASFGIKPKYPVSATLAGDLSISGSRQTTEVVESDKQLSLFSVTQSKTSEGYYRWDCVPSLGTTLDGRPWDAIAQPRLQVKDTRTKQSHLAGEMRVEIRCRREDLLIQDITIKDESVVSKLTTGSLLKNKIVIVEAYLKHLLTTQRLSFTNLSDPYGTLCVADVGVEESQP